VCAFLLPNSFYDIYVHFARVISGFFLLVQIVILIDFAYSWNSEWLEPPKEWKGAILAVSTSLYLASLAGLILMFVYFGGLGCDLQKFFIAFTLIFTLAFTTLSVSSKIEHGALLPSAVVTAYCYYLLFSALSSDPSHCNSLNSNDAISMVIGLVFGAASISYAGWSLASSDTAAIVEAEENRAEDAAAATGDYQQIDAAEEGKRPAKVPIKSPASEDADPELTAEEEVAQSKRNAKFHFVMASSAMYMAMLLTSWGSRQQVEADDHGGWSTVAYDLNVESMWIKIVTQWATGGLYIWTLLAPYVCSNRDGFSS